MNPRHWVVKWIFPRSGVKHPFSDYRTGSAATGASLEGSDHREKGLTIQQVKPKVDYYRSIAGLVWIISSRYLTTEQGIQLELRGEGSGSKDEPPLPGKTGDRRNSGDLRSGALGLKDGTFARHAMRWFRPADCTELGPGITGFGQSINHPSPAQLICPDCDSEAAAIRLRS